MTVREACIFCLRPCCVE